MHSERLLDHFQNPRNAGELAPPAVKVDVTNPACGDMLRLSARFEKGRVAGVDGTLAGDQKTAGGVLFAGHFAQAREFTGAEQDAGTGTKVERSHCPLFSRSS